MVIQYDEHSTTYNIGHTVVKHRRGGKPDPNVAGLEFGVSGLDVGT